MAKKAFERLGNSKTRTLLILGAIVLVIIVIVIMFSARKPNPLKTEESHSSKIPQITAIPGNVTSEKYQALQEEDNRRRAAEAKKLGGSAVATIIGSREKDLLSQKESFGIEGELLGNCKCGGELSPAEAAKLIAEVEAHPEEVLKLMQQNPGLAKALCNQRPELALKVIQNNKEAARIMLKECPAMIKALADKNPALLNELVGEEPSIATSVKDMMKTDPAFAAKMFKENPKMVEKLMLGDKEFAKSMTQIHPDLVKKLMEDDPAFARALLASTPGLNALLNPRPLSNIQLENQAKRAQEARLNEQQQKALAALLTNMESQSKAVYQAWNEVIPQAFVQGDKTEDKTSEGNSGGSGSGGKNSGSRKDVLLKAGTILFAVLDTAVNSDEPSPIMATVTLGQYKGAKLVGDLQLASQGGSGGASRPEKVVLNFSTMNIPSFDKSISVKAVAIDPDTARTAMASDVDHHYLLRYGSLFASSFMTGYAKVITNAGTVQTNSSTGNTTTTTPTLSGRQQVLAALGEVGKAFGTAASTYFNSPNTITVDAGTGIGLLILSDVTDSGS